MQVKHLSHYAQFLTTIRLFFSERKVLEVKTPLLSNYAVSDAYIDSATVSLNCHNHRQRYYLHTSPEMAMKQLLLEGSGDIYQICPVFRDNEDGTLNRNEFTMLEWYRLDFDMIQLMDEVALLINTVLPDYEVIKYSYQQLFKRYVGVDNIHHIAFGELKQIAERYGLANATDEMVYDDAADVQIHLFVHCIAPELKKIPALFVYDYPQDQALLAQLSNGVAKRFELFVNGIELANGYEELTEVADYQQRFLASLDKRQRLGLTTVDIDKDFLGALSSALPSSSGVAIGLDRLFMLHQGECCLLS